MSSNSTAAETERVDRIDTLTEQLVNLMNDQASWQSTWSDRQHPSNALKSDGKYKVLENEKKKLKELQEENQKLRSELDSITSQWNQSKEEGMKAQVTAQELRKQLTDLQHCRDAQQAALNHNNKTLEEKAVIEQQLRATIAENNKTLEEKAATEQQLRATIADLKRKSLQDQQLLIRARKMYTAADKATYQLSQTKQSLESELKSKTKDLNELKASHQTLQKSCEDLRRKDQKELEEAAAKIQKLIEAEKQLKQFCHAREEELQKKTEHEQILSDTIRKLHERLASIVDESDNKLKESKRVQDQLYRKMCEHSSQKVKAQKELVKLKVQLRQYQGRLDLAKNQMVETVKLLSDCTLSAQSLKRDEVDQESTNFDFHTHQLGAISLDKLSGVSYNQSEADQTKLATRSSPIERLEQGYSTQRELKIMSYQVQHNLDQTIRFLLMANERFQQLQEQTDQKMKLSESLETEFEGIQELIFSVLRQLAGIAESYKVLRQCVCKELTS